MSANGTALADEVRAREEKERLRSLEDGAASDALAEITKVRSKYKPFNSAHEAYGVLAEEVNEFWDEVKKRRTLRNPQRMREELIQIAAVAIRAAVDLCTPKREAGRCTKGFLCGLADGHAGDCNDDDLPF